MPKTASRKSTRARVPSAAAAAAAADANAGAQPQAGNPGQAAQPQPVNPPAQPQSAGPAQSNNAVNPEAELGPPGLPQPIDAAAPRRQGRVTIAGLQAQLEQEQEQSRIELQALQAQLQQALGSSAAAPASAFAPVPGPALQPTAPVTVATTSPAPPVVAAAQAQSEDRIAELEAQIAELRNMRMQPPPMPQAGPGYQPMAFGGAPQAWPALAPSAMPGVYQVAPPGFQQAAVGWTPPGGESDISHHYTALPAGKLEKIMMGDIQPTDIYQAIPSDSVLYPIVNTTEKSGSFQWDSATGQFTLSDGGLAQMREKGLTRLSKTLDQPIKFAHAWGWFVVLTNFKYRDPDLSAAMMRFGWKVVSYSLSNDWAICLRVFAELATPLLTGNLLQVKERFDTVSFSEALGPYRSQVSANSSTSSFANTVVNPGPVSASVSATAPSTVKPAAKADKLPVCRRFNEGKCNGIGCRYQHICYSCGFGHPSIYCPGTPPQVAQQPHQPGAYVGSQAPYPAQQPSYNVWPAYNSQGFPLQQGYASAPTYGQPQQSAPGFVASQANAVAGPSNAKPRNFGSAQQGKGGQA